MQENQGHPYIPYCVIMLSVVDACNCGSCIGQALRVTTPSGVSVDVDNVTCGGTSDVATSPDVQNSRRRLVIYNCGSCIGQATPSGASVDYTSICLLFCTSGDVLIPPQVTLSLSKLTDLKVQRFSYKSITLQFAI